jgi:hypothetical protein
MDELNDEQKRDRGEELQEEIADHFVKLRKAGMLEQRQLEWWLKRLRKRLFLQFGYDLGDADKEQTGEFLR